MLCALSRSFARSQRACPLVLVRPAARLLLHTPFGPKSAVRPHLLPPTHAGILVPAKVDGDIPVDLGPRASSLRFPLSWAGCLLLFLGSWPLACGKSLLRTMLTY
jgi:hypothetical protein